MVSTTLLKKAAKKGKKKAGWPGMVLFGAAALAAQYVAKRKLKKYVS
jgi:hypothetical protein